MKPLLTIPIQESDLNNIEKILKKKLDKVDAFEIWIDQFRRSDQKPEIVQELCKKWKKLSKKKLLFVCKDKAEKGKFVGFTRQKVDLLIAAAQAGADYVDIGIHSGKNLVSKLRDNKKKSKLIISWHDFLKTPNFKRLEKIAGKLIDYGADVVKIATLVDSVLDNENLMFLALDLKKNHQKHIIIGMGTLGVTTRVFSKHLGNEMNFVSLDANTAPGQLTLEEILQFQAVLDQ